MFRGRRGRGLIGPRLLLAATALSARTWRTLLVSRGRGALLLPWRGGPLRRGHGALLLPGYGGPLRRRHGALLLPWRGGLVLRRGYGAPRRPWRRNLLLSRGHGTRALARNSALRWRRRRPLGRWEGALGRWHSRRT